MKIMVRVMKIITITTVKHCSNNFCGDDRYAISDE